MVASVANFTSAVATTYPQTVLAATVPTTSPGNLMVLMVCTLSSTVTATDNASNIYTHASGSPYQTAGGLTSHTLTAPVAAAATSVTVTLNAGDFLHYVVYEVQKADGSPVDVVKQNGNSATSAATSLASPTPTASRDLALGCVSWYNPSAATADTGPAFSPGGVGVNHFANSTANGNFKISSSSVQLTSALAQTFATTIDTTNQLWSAWLVLIRSAGEPIGTRLGARTRPAPFKPGLAR